MKKILLSFMILLLMGVVCGQDSNQVRKYIRALASPEFHGRGYAYNGDSIAAEYLRAQLRALDVEPFVKDYYHKYGFNVYAMEGPVKAALNGEKLRPWEDFALAPFSHSADEMFLLLPIKPEDILNPDKLLGFCQKNSEKLSKSLLFVDMTKCKDKEMVNDLGTVFRHLYMYNGQLPFRGFVAAVNDILVVQHCPAGERLCDGVYPSAQGEKVLRDVPFLQQCALLSPDAECVRYGAWHGGS